MDPDHDPTGTFDPAADKLLYRSLLRAELPSPGITVTLGLICARPPLFLKAACYPHCTIVTLGLGRLAPQILFSPLQMKNQRLR